MERLPVVRAITLAAIGCLGTTDVPSSPPRFLGRYTGQATVTTSPYYPPGAYGAEAAVAQTPSGIVGFVNIVFDPADAIGGTITHAFSARVAGSSTLLTLGYSDRLCGAGDPIGKCYPHAPYDIQYSFGGQATFAAGMLTLSTPSIVAGLPYGATLPFDSIEMVRSQNEPRLGFDGVYANLEYIWMGTVLLPLPTPLFGNNHVVIVNGEVTEWIADDGSPLPPGIIAEECFDDSRGLGWMNQQGAWSYYWVRDPDGEGVAVIVTFDATHPDCANLQDPLADGELDRVHQDLVGVMFESSAPVSGAGMIRDLRVSRNGTMLELFWLGDCGAANRYSVYRGDLAAGYDSLAPVSCSALGTSVTIPAGVGTADFFLVAPNRMHRDGSYGLDSRNIRRPPPTDACFPPGPIDSCAP